MKGEHSGFNFKLSSTTLTTAMHIHHVIFMILCACDLSEHTTYNLSGKSLTQQHAMCRQDQITLGDEDTQGMDLTSNMVMTQALSQRFPEAVLNTQACALSDESE